MNKLIFSFIILAFSTLGFCSLNVYAYDFNHSLESEAVQVSSFQDLVDLGFEDMYYIFDFDSEYSYFYLGTIPFEVDEGFGRLPVGLLVPWGRFDNTHTWSVQFRSSLPVTNISIPVTGRSSEHGIPNMSGNRNIGSLGGGMSSEWESFTALQRPEGLNFVEGTFSFIASGTGVFHSNNPIRHVR